MTGVEGPLIGGSLNPSLGIIQGSLMYLKRKHDYVRKMDRNFKKMEVEAKYLFSKRNDLLTMKERNDFDMDMTEEFTTWLENVKNIEKEVQILNTRYQSVQMSFWGRLQLFARIKLGKQIVKRTEELTKLKDRIKSVEIMIPKMPEVSDKNLGKSRDTIPSICEQVDNLLELLRNEQVKIIGIWGIPGVGKSFLLKELNDKVWETGMFENVIFIEAQEEDTVGSIQRDLVARLGITVRNVHSQVQLSTMISEKLGKSRFLLLLDQIPSCIDLSRVGIRHPFHENGKIVIATRQKIDCDKMGTDEMIHMEKLSKKDAWDFFAHIVGSDAMHPHINTTAKQIVHELGGVPQVIRAMATSLKGEPESAWNDALSALRSLNESKLQHLDEVFAAFKFLYRKLNADDKEKCLLYGTLFPKDFEIDKDSLVECWTAERFIHDEIFRKARDAGDNIMQGLIKMCLMEQCARERYVTIPTIFWMVAQRIPYPPEERCSSYVKAGDGLSELPAEEDWRTAKRISFMCNNLESLTGRPKCHDVSTLFLQRNKKLQEINDSFFLHMQKLQVLDLCRTSIVKLPSSLLKIKLKALCLNHCWQLTALPNKMGEVEKTLEFLDIRGTGMTSFPPVIEKLCSLICLKVSFTYERTSPHSNSHVAESWVLPRGRIGGLQHLQELTIEVDPVDERWYSIADEVVDDMAKLKKLTTLDFVFPNLASLENFIGSSKSWNNSFRSFRFTVGNSHQVNYSYSYGLDIRSLGAGERYLRLSTGEDISSDVVTEVLKKSNKFELIDHPVANNLSDGVLCVSALTICIINNCGDMKSLVSGSKATGGIVFRYLKSLHIINLPKLHSLMQGPLDPSSLAYLSVLTLNGCNKLNEVFSKSVAKQLGNLRHLRVEDCHEMKYVIGVDHPEDFDKIVQVEDLSGFLSNLEILELMNLQSLVDICQNGTYYCKNLQLLEVKQCSALKSLSALTHKARVSKIRCTEIWWKELELQDRRVKESLGSCCEFLPVELPTAYATPDCHDNSKVVNGAELTTQVRESLRMEATPRFFLQEYGESSNEPSPSRVSSVAVQ